jgi:hypothetical protein
MGLKRTVAGDAASRRLSRELGWLSALGVLSAAAIAVSLNVLVERFGPSFDLTSDRLYSLSPPTVETLGGLSEEVVVLVFMSQQDPDIGAVRRLLRQYEVASSLLKVRYVDPDRDPAEFAALKNRYQLMEGRAEAGRLVSDAAMVVARGDARWVITPDDLLSRDEEAGTAQPRVELAVAEGLRQVLHPQPRQVCFSQGHGEPELADGGPTGLGALRYMLEKNNYELTELDLAGNTAEAKLNKCDLVVVAAPTQLFSPAVAARLAFAARQGKSLLLSVGPRLSEDEQIVLSGLAPVLDTFGVAMVPQLIFERDPDLALPTGVGGEVFLATPDRHALTAGLRVDGEARHRVLMQMAQGLTGGELSKRLLFTSDKAFAVDNASAISGPQVNVDDIERDREGPFAVAMAAELSVSAETPSASVGAERGARLVAIGSSSPLLGRTWHDPSLSGTRRFVESAVAWLTSRPSLVRLPEKPARDLGMSLTEGSLAEVARYVMVYMPLTALALGILILYRRRWTGKATSSEGGAGP